MVGFNLGFYSHPPRTGTFTFHYGRIQSSSRRAQAWSQTHLHSIMVGFNRDGQRHRPKGLFDLHSIMVGFNPLCWMRPARTTRIYIPLWSDSINSEVIVPCVPINLHSIMVGFNRASPSASEFRLQKFTFHYGRIQSPAFPRWCTTYPHLHSIMVGFNLSGLKISSPSKVIYIPLWSDSIGVPDWTEKQVTLIYIPLWSDSIRLKRLRARSRILIYIPLWSDSIDPAAVRVLLNKAIYIPLWSDSIRRALTTNRE